MPNHRSVTETTDLTETSRVTDKTAATTAQIKGSARSPSNASAGLSLYLYDASDAKISGFAGQLAKAYYAGAKVAGINSISEMAGQLSKYQLLEKLILFSHSIPGSLIINSVSNTSSFVNNLLAKSKAKVSSQIIFEGCELMQDPIEACKMVVSVAGKDCSLKGYSYYTITQVVSFDFSQIQDDQVIKGQYKQFDNRYWLPGLPDPKLVHGKKIKHGRRWFRPVMDHTAPEGKNFRDIESYTSLKPVTVNSHKEAKELKESYNAPVYPGNIITANNISAIATGK